MPNILDKDGLQVATQEELITYYTNNYKSIYGANINLSQNSADGQLMNIEIQAAIDNLELFLSIFNSFDPDNAVGKVLDQRVAINGIQRQAGTYSTTNIELVLTQSVNLYGQDQTVQAVYTVSDNAGNQWQLLTTQTGVGPGTVTYSFQAVTPGAVLTEPNTIRTPVTIVLGVSSVNNPDPQTNLGLNEESDAALRVRRLQSVSAASQGYLAGLLSTLENINGVTSAFVYENNSGSTDANGVPGHSIWVIVSGTPAPALGSVWSSIVTYSYGQIASLAGVNYISWQNNNLNHTPPNATYWGVYNAVAMAIYDKRNAGCGMKGDTSYTVTQIDGTQFNVYWDVVTLQNLFIAFQALSLNGITPPNVELLLDPILGLPAIFKPAVNDEVNINELGTLVQQIDPNTLSIAFAPTGGFSTGIDQILNLSVIPSGGSFKIDYNGVLSAAILFSDNASQIQTKLRSMAGLGNCVVTGSVASQILLINIGDYNALSLLTVPSATNLLTPSTTFTYDEYYENVLLPTKKNYQFNITASNIIITPIIFVPPVFTLENTISQSFYSWGGYGTMIYDLATNASGASLSPGVTANSVNYTSGAVPGIDILRVTDALGNTATVTITVT